jgi:hypothetical protein
MTLIVNRLLSVKTLSYHKRLKPVHMLFGPIDRSLQIREDVISALIRLSRGIWKDRTGLLWMEAMPTRHLVETAKIEGNGGAWKDGSQTIGSLRLASPAGIFLPARGKTE